LDKTFINKLLNNREIDLWDAQFRGLLLKTIQAQAKYIKLLERKMYSVDTLTMKDGHLYTLEFNTEPLEVPETLPIAQKMIDTFRITTPQATSVPPNATETANPLSPFSITSPTPESGSLEVEEGRIQNDEGE
jgi:hypothetical protein